MGFLLRFFLIFIIAYSIYSLLMFLIRLLSGQFRKNIHHKENVRYEEWNRQNSAANNKVIELTRDQYKVE